MVCTRKSTVPGTGWNLKKPKERKESSRAKSLDSNSIWSGWAGDPKSTVLKPPLSEKGI